MRLGSKIIVGSVFLIGLILSWYLFIKPYDYQIRFTKKTSPGTLYKSAEGWGLDAENGLTLLKEKKTPFQNIQQDFKLQDSLLQFNWEFNGKNDSSTAVIVRINDRKHSIATRIKNLFSDPPLKYIALSKLTDFNKNLDSHLKKFTVEIVGVEEIPEGFYAYLETECTLSQKAATMISKNSEVAGWLNDKKIAILAQPSLEVRSWDIEKDSISYRFMFPIEEVDSLPYHEKIKFKKNKPRKGLKAIFHGNYQISDRAWFALLEYSNLNGIDVEKKPIEFFFDNPMLGGNELRWKAEVFLPLTNQNE